MIRRQAGDQFLLITQHEHALISGGLAGHYGNGRFARCEPESPTIRAIALHDCGWPLHDEQPTLNKHGFPLDVFETPLPLALRVWSAACERAASEPDYTQLLISLHVLGLSAFAATNKHTRVEEFELNRFQHAEIERQENLRRRMGMRLDVPLRLGLAMVTTIAQEEQLRRNHLILQAMDRLSLAVCCTEPPFARIENIIPKAGAAPISFSFTPTGPTGVRVAPWPFDEPSLHFAIPCRGVPAREYSLSAFREAYSAAPAEELQVTIES